ncbi:superoxide dismutase [Candidatus Mesenet endosymbiont of Phosphuga atrata]|uniref:superoxide dismutase n=1 Tax=Candidatus Mesenet endosymbiont of Phosphuga atrata TaxID=3066221 RepID=UPI0030CBDE53
MTFSLPDLPYDENALEPYISAKTMNFHYGKHHKGYVDKLNLLLGERKTEYEGRFTGNEEDLKILIKETHNNNSKVSIFNNAAQIWNHTFYWQSMKKDGGSTPQDGSAIAKKIRDDLGGVDKFTETFSEYGANQFGSGWVWLVLENNKLKIVKTSNAEQPLPEQIPLLVMDVWEHAYYLDCQNRRIDYISIFLKHLVNWDFADKNLSI